MKPQNGHELSQRIISVPQLFSLMPVQIVIPVTNEAVGWILCQGVDLVFYISFQRLKATEK
jgi:hypothetical protein